MDVGPVHIDEEQVCQGPTIDGSTWPAGYPRAARIDPVIAMRTE